MISKVRLYLAAAIPSVEVCTSEVPTHFALLVGYLAFQGH